jgi:hypothetical protein
MPVPSSSDYIKFKRMQTVLTAFTKENPLKRRIPSAYQSYSPTALIRTIPPNALRPVKEMGGGGTSGGGGGGTVSELDFLGGTSLNDVPVPGLVWTFKAKNLSGYDITQIELQDTLQSLALSDIASITISTIPDITIQGVDKGGKVIITPTGVFTFDENSVITITFTRAFATLENIAFTVTGGGGGGGGGPVTESTQISFGGTKQASNIQFTIIQAFRLEFTTVGIDDYSVDYASIYITNPGFEINSISTIAVYLDGSTPSSITFSKEDMGGGRIKLIASEVFRMDESTTKFIVDFGIAVDSLEKIEFSTT